MEKFKFIKYLDIDYWWRTAIVEDENKNTLKVSFMEELEEKCVFNEGDIFEANIVINLICQYNIVNNQEKYYMQNVNDSPHIEAVVKVEKTIDKYQILASSNIIKENIILDFESKIDEIRENDIIQVIGELNIENESIGIHSL